MANLYIAELAGLAESDAGGSVNIAPMPPLREQKIAFTGTHAESAAFGADTNFVLVSCDASACSIAVGAAPVATVANMRLDIYQDPIFRVKPGDKISVILSDVV